MAEHHRGRGVETDSEKGYIASTLQLCAGLITKSTDAYQNSFADIASFAPSTFNWNVLRRRS